MKKYGNPETKRKNISKIIKEFENYYESNFENNDENSN